MKCPLARRRWSPQTGVLVQFWYSDDENAKVWVSERREVFWNQCSFSYGRVAQLGEHLLCKHAFIYRHFTVQIPLQVGLPVGLQKIRALCDPFKHGGPDVRKSIRAVSLRAARGFLE
jgi:hypothetical protein